MTAYVRHSPGTPFRWCAPRSVHSMMDPASASRTVWLTRISPGARGLDACADVHRETGKVSALLFDLAQVQPASHIEIEGNGLRSDSACDLDRDRRAGDHNEEVVATGVHLPGVVAVENDVHHDAELGEQVTPRLVADRRCSSSGSRNVGEERNLKRTLGVRSSSAPVRNSATSPRNPGVVRATPWSTSTSTTAPPECALRDSDSADRKQTGRCRVNDKRARRDLWQ